MLYIITDGLHYKLGYSQDPEARLKGLQTSNAKPLTLLATTEGTLKDEKYYHKLLANTKMVGEWFELSHDLLLILLNWKAEPNLLPSAPGSDLLLESYAQGLVLSYLIRNNVSQSELNQLKFNFSKDCSSAVSFILQTLITFADFNSRLTQENEGQIKNLVKQHWLSVNKPEIHPWIAVRQLSLSHTLNQGCLAEQALYIHRDKLATAPLDVKAIQNCLNPYSLNELTGEIGQVLGLNFDAPKSVFKFIIDELKARNNLGLLTMYRQRQMEYQLLFDKLIRGKAPLADIPDNYFATYEPAKLGSDILWLGE